MLPVVELIRDFEKAGKPVFLYKLNRFLLH